MGGMVDYKGRPISRSATTGGWTSALFIIGVETAERFSYSGISSNLISYLTGPLRQSTAAGAANANAWSGTANMLPILGAVVADSWLGRYRTILLSSLLYVLGLALLTLSAALLSLGSSDCDLSKGEISSCPPPSPFHVIIFFFSLYLVALGQGGHKPCVQAFGADQFDDRDPSESKARSSFFNWWYVGICLGCVAAYMVLNYIQDYVSWTVAFGLQCAAMALALVVFMLGTKTYRHLVLDDKSPFLRIANVYFEVFRNRKTPTTTFDEAGETPLLHEETQFESLDHKAEVTSVHYHVSSPSKQVDSICINSLTEEETQTLFTKQGNTMERDMGFGYQIPAASLQLFSSIVVVVFVPIYDLVLVPIGRMFAGNPSGITMLQRIGIGMVLSAASMVSAGLVEMKRLKTARDFGLVDMPNLPLPMSIWWLVPQYVVFGYSDFEICESLH
uniref:Protein NRT1/ PTR FAMILY 5.10 n=1 Tax=Elaeis guineensis var. tenera TaxID=51953 RepID=A0A8N4F019_ELAGV|nr:protein NRT1/ PTR FAMILY 5.10 [Elaeis guineensis]